MEYLDVVDDLGNPTGQVVERSIAHQKGIQHRTSHVWLIREKEGKLEILLQKRSLNKDSFPGCYDISSAGHIPAGFDYKESAIRELEEELGVQAEADDLIECGIRKFEYEGLFHNQYFHDKQISKVFYLIYEKDAFIIQESELESVLWMNFDVCYEKVKNDSFKHCIYLKELDMVKETFEKSRLKTSKNTG